MDTPLMDFDALLERMEGDRELILEIFTVFIEEVPLRREKFDKALADGDIQGMVLLAHSLKGASGTLHAGPLREACYDLEHAARNGNAELVRSLAPLVLDLLNRTAGHMAELKKGL